MTTEVFASAPLERKHPGDAGYDLTAVCPEDGIYIPAGEWRLIPTDLFLAMPPWMEAQIRTRSGLAVKYGLHVLNSPGTIDSGYRDRVRVILMNSGHDDYVVEHGDRIAQLVFAPVLHPDFIAATPPQICAMMSSRGPGGFGSTGVSDD